MCGIVNYPAFLAAVFLFQLIPGPGTITILHETARGGRRAGMWAVVGTLCGDMLYMAGAVLGLAAFFVHWPVLFSSLRWLGIFYLLVQGVKLMLSRTGKDECDVSSLPSCCRQGAALRRGFLVSLTNPKVVLFFMAFFPLFMGNAHSFSTLLCMMVHVTGISLLYQILLVCLGILARKVIKRNSHCIERCAGLAFLAIGIRLIFVKE